jgi:uncharacterized protein
MDAPGFLFDGSTSAAVTVALAHGAGAPMDSPFMTFFAQGLAQQGCRVARFEFPYMAGRRQGGGRRPPDRLNVLLDCWRTVIDRLGPERLVIGGKSLGGRMASMVADPLGVRALVCLGYPFHPPGRPETLRIEHLRRLETPALILQGTRDPFGDPKDVADYPLSPAVRVHWLADGDHGFTPRVSSGRTEKQNWQEALAVVGAFISETAQAG